MVHCGLTGPCCTSPLPACSATVGHRSDDVAMELADEQREWVQRTEALLEWMDEDGIVCIPPVRGEPPARDRFLGLLAAAYGDVPGATPFSLPCSADVGSQQSR